MGTRRNKKRKTHSRAKLKGKPSVEHKCPQAQPHAEQDQAKPDPPLAPNKRPAQEPQQPRYSRETCRPDQIPIWKIVLEFATFLAAVGIGLIYWGQLRQMIEGNKINREALETVQRAFVTTTGIDQHRLKHPNGYFWTLRIIWQNSGVTPAVNLVNAGSVQALSAEPTEQQFRTSFDPSSLVQITIGPKAEASSGPLFRPDSLFFGKEIGDLNVIPPSVPPPEIEGNVYLWGWAMYRDVFSESPIHLTEICLHLSDADRSSDGKAIRLDFSLTKEHNCTDTECSDYEQMVALYPKRR